MEIFYAVDGLVEKVRFMENQKEIEIFGAVVRLVGKMGSQGKACPTENIMLSFWNNF